MNILGGMQEAHSSRIEVPDVKGKVFEGYIINLTV